MPFYGAFMLPYITNLQQQTTTSWTFDLFFTLSAHEPYGSSLFKTTLAYSP